MAVLPVESRKSWDQEERCTYNIHKSLHKLPEVDDQFVQSDKSFSAYLANLLPPQSQEVQVVGDVGDGGRVQPFLVHNVQTRIKAS